ncbi:flavin reductase family protein [Robertkochia marina]|uniref:Flavin reductase family protein n=1 Tax=Robertkochia marina TaxID=1227945 RepID=A0A4S3M4D0_9FLAO|nr:flavin reductase family protein [Robertkochia marina]THD69655.1 flavin reductase family protein [Robertkochia marina]TRZ47059.1 flavin reductase family protein [Robertkochia marina]
MLTIDPKDVSTAKLHGYLLGAVGPRPIAFASTISKDGHVNLSPFSFFNVFSANPPVMIFSPARRVRDNTTKHTLENAMATREVVVNVVNYDIVQQMSLSSTEYPEGVNEFEKAGLTMQASEVVTPFRVKESPVQFECKVLEVKSLGAEGGAGNLVICEVVRMHIDENILDADGRIDQHKIDLVSRMGGNWYSRANMGLFEVPKPLSSLGIGVDSIPEAIRLSKVLTGNDLGKLGNIEQLPQDDEVAAYLKGSVEARKVISSGEETEVHAMAHELLNENKIAEAWKLLLAAMK